MKAKLYISVLLILGLNTALLGQSDGIDTIPRISKDAFLSDSDSLSTVGDSLKVDNRKKFSVSKDSLDAPVEYISDDSMHYDILNKQIHLYGNASVTYTSISLKADYILLDWATNTVTAKPLKDSLGRLSGIPEFSDGGENFTAKGIRYNFKSRKGIITDATSTQNDMYVLSKKGKFVAKDPSDSLRTDDVIYSKDAIFTSCNLDHPHYGIRSNKQKVVPGKTVVVGPSNLEIGGIPTPLWLPFGFFPITSTAKSGLIIPRDYEYDPLYGFGISNIGYFTPLGEYANLQLTADYYFKKRWGAHIRSQFKKIHKYNGVFSFDYGSLPTEIDGEVFRESNYRVSLRLDQDRSAHPTLKFGGNVDFQKGNYTRRFLNDFNSVVNNQINSRLNFSYNPTKKPFTLSASLNANQNSSQGTTTINFPNLDFNMRRVYPFKKKVPGSKEQWYEKIGLTYNASAKNKYVAVDSTLFQGSWWDDMEYGAQHNINLNTTFNFLKYFRFTPNANYSGTVYFKEREIDFDPTNILTPTDTLFNDPDNLDDFTVVYDTTYGTQNIDTFDRVNYYQDFGGGVSLGFDVYNTLKFKKGKIKGVRHVMRPNLSYNYSPNFRDTSLGIAWDYIGRAEFDTRFKDSIQEYSKFLQNGVYGSPNPGGEQQSMSFGVSNVIQSKYIGKDSTEKYLNIIDEFALNGSYNFAISDDDYSENRRTLPMSPIAFRLRSNLFKDFTSIVISGSFDPYSRDENNQRTNVFVWDDDNSNAIIPLDFVTANMPLTNRLTVKKIRGWITGVGSDKNEEELVPEDEERRQRNSPKKKANLKEGGGFWDLFDNWTINHDMRFSLDRKRFLDEDDMVMAKDTFTISRNSLRIRGDLQLTPGWKITIDNLSYDFKNKSLVYPSFRFYRDLHCWEMGLGWQPARGTYNFFLRVKPGTLGFIEVPYQQRNFSGF